jgi:hypothetical protein
MRHAVQPAAIMAVAARHKQCLTSLDDLFELLQELLCTGSHTHAQHAVLICRLLLAWPLATQPCIKSLACCG